MLAIVIFGLSAGVLFDILIGLLGSRRHIGFGWAFIISIIFTPIIGLIATLLSPSLPDGAEPKYGCLGFSFGCLGAAIMILVVVAILVGVIAAFLPML